MTDHATTVREAVHSEAVRISAQFVYKAKVSSIPVITVVSTGTVGHEQAHPQVTAAKAQQFSVIDVAIVAVFFFLGCIAYSLEDKKRKFQKKPADLSAGFFMGI